jgi:hypothetical protein
MANEALVANKEAQVVTNVLLLMSGISPPSVARGPRRSRGLDNRNNMKKSIWTIGENETKGGYQTLRTVVWIERWIEVSAIRSGSVTRISGTTISGRMGMGNGHSRWNRLTAAFEENCE